MPPLDTDRHRHRQGAVLPAHHGKAGQQQGGGEAEPAADPARGLRRAPEPHAARRALRHPRDRRVAAAQRQRGARPRARARDRAQLGARTQAVPQGRRHDQEHDRTQEARAPHRERHLWSWYSITALRHRAGTYERACHERWSGCRYQCRYESGRFAAIARRRYPVALGLEPTLNGKS